MSLERHRREWLLASMGALWISVTGLSAAADDPTNIVVKNFMFTPMNLTVKAGAKVTWTNMDDESHTVASDDRLFRSAALDSNESFSYKFEKPGTYHYTCTIHPRMVGTITVE